MQPGLRAAFITRSAWSQRWWLSKPRDRTAISQAWRNPNIKWRDLPLSKPIRVGAALLELLPSGRPSVQDVAKALGVSTRTLQRRLQEEGCHFQLILDATRERLARYYLKQSSMSGAEISLLLGFEDPNSFVRAFHGWTGHTLEQQRSGLH